MRTLFFSIAASMLAFGCAGGGAGEPAGERVAYVNAQVWNGENFRRSTLVVEDGRFVEASARNATRTIDLAEGFVVPPIARRTTTISDRVGK